MVLLDCRMAVHVALEGILARREETGGQSNQDTRHKTEKISRFRIFHVGKVKIFHVTCAGLTCLLDCKSWWRALALPKWRSHGTGGLDRQLISLGSDGFTTGRLVVECSGVAEPESIAAELEAGCTMMIEYETE